MKKVNDRYINSMVKKMLNETLEERADDLVTRLKTNVNEKLGGMDDGHPKFGKKNFTTMTPEEIEARAKALIELFSEWDRQDDADEQRETWEYLQQALGEELITERPFSLTV